MTTEQAIILAFLAAAFVAGWIARALVGAVRREAGPAGREPEAIVPAPRSEEAVHSPPPESAVPFPIPRGAVLESRHELARAIRAYHAAVVRTLRNGKYEGSGESTLEALAGALVALSRAVDHASAEMEGAHPLTERLQSTGVELRRLADDVMRHSREREVPAGVLDQLEQHLISAASMLLHRDRLQPRAA